MMFASIKTLLSSVVDYAGLFPPAKLDLQEAMAHYARYQGTPYSWMLGCFVLPVSQWSEFESQLSKFPFEAGKTQPWVLSLILSGNLEIEINHIRSIQHRKDIAIAALEFPPLPLADIEAIAADIPHSVDTFFELSLNSELAAYLDTLQRLGASAKIRTGGLTADAFPSTPQLGQFILACIAAQVPFKATAGLHHPLPARHRLTSEADSLAASMHGFLTVAIAASFIYQHKITAAEMLEILKEPSIEAFQFQAESISWRHHSLNLAEIENTRRHFFRSFGSCSFQAPVDNLKWLKLLS